MGTDVHAGIEYLQPGVGWKALFVPNKYFGKWDDEPKMTARLRLDRDYDLFAILGDVRNGSGFAGCKTGEGFVPMSSQRGIPSDVTAEVRDNVLSNEHSPTWVTLAEILAYDWRRSTTHYGVIGTRTFEEWDRMKEWHPAPDSYSGGVVGRDIVHVSEDAMREHVNNVMGDKRFDNREDKLKQLDPNMYTRVSWTLPYAVSGSQVWTGILPHMLPLGAEYGYDNVRLVMDFDS